MPEIIASNMLAAAIARRFSVIRVPPFACHAVARSSRLIRLANRGPCYSGPSFLGLSFKVPTRGSLPKKALQSSIAQATSGAWGGSRRGAWGPLRALGARHDLVFAGFDRTIFPKEFARHRRTYRRRYRR